MRGGGGQKIAKLCPRSCLMLPKQRFVPSIGNIEKLFELSAVKANWPVFGSTY